MSSKDSINRYIREIDNGLDTTLLHGLRIHDCDYIQMREVFSTTATRRYMPILTNYPRKTNVLRAQRENLCVQLLCLLKMLFEQIRIYESGTAKVWCTLRISKSNSKGLDGGGAFTDICGRGIYPTSVTSNIFLEWHFRGDYINNASKGRYCSDLHRLSKFDLGALLYAFCWSSCVSGILRRRCLVLSTH